MCESRIPAMTADATASGAMARYVRMCLDRASAPPKEVTNQRMHGLVDEYCNVPNAELERRYRKAAETSDSLTRASGNGLLSTNEWVPAVLRPMGAVVTLSRGFEGLPVQEWMHTDYGCVGERNHRCLRKEDLVQCQFCLAFVCVWHRTHTGPLPASGQRPGASLGGILVQCSDDSSCRRRRYIMDPATSATYQ